MVKSCLNVLERYLRAIGEIFERELLLLSYWCLVIDVFSIERLETYFGSSLCFFGNVVFFWMKKTMHLAVSLAVSK